MCEGLSTVLGQLTTKARVAHILATANSNRIAINSADYSDTVAQLDKFHSIYGPDIPNSLERRLGPLSVVGFWGGEIQRGPLVYSPTWTLSSGYHQVAGGLVSGTPGTGHELPTRFRCPPSSIGTRKTGRPLANCEWQE